MYRSAHPPRFVSSVGQLDECLRSAKLRRCPHCKRSGTLIGHGYLRGYAERSTELVVRGRRLFCSDRFLGRGCGRTVAILLDHLLPRHTVCTTTLLDFVKAIVGGASRRAAWQTASSKALGLTSGYRLWRRLQLAQSYLRTKLSSVTDPTESAATEPFVQLLEHIQTTFAVERCPFSSFQSRLQSPLLP